LTTPSHRERALGVILMVCGRSAGKSVEKKSEKSTVKVSKKVIEKNNAGDERSGV